MKYIIMVALMVAACMAAEKIEETKSASTNKPMAEVEAPASTNAPASKTNAQPTKIELESAKALASQPARIPVYVLPEVILVRLPNFNLFYVEEHHVRELAKKFPAQRLTNIIVYADGL